MLVRTTKVNRGRARGAFLAKVLKRVLLLLAAPRINFVKLSINYRIPLKYEYKFSCFQVGNTVIHVILDVYFDFPAINAWIIVS